MTGPRSRFESDSVPAATGVAAGGLGTGANLEDTQVFDMEDLAAEAPAGPAKGTVQAAAAPKPESKAEPLDHEPATAAPPAGKREASRPVAAPIPAAVAAPVAERVAEPVQVRPTVTRRGAGPSRQPGRGLAGLLAAALVVLAGVAFVVATDRGTLDAGQAVPTADAAATAEPESTGGGDGNGDRDQAGADPGKDDNGKGKGCRGKGHGHGNGCDDDDDDDD